MKVIIVLALLVHTGYSLKFGQLCSGYSNNQKRGCDSEGCGAYDEHRLHGKHKGLDIKCDDGNVVYAPFDLNLRGRSYPYSNPTASQKKINDGINLKKKDGGLCVKLFYVKPDKTTGFVKKGDRIGIMLPMKAANPKTTSHIHVQMCDHSDPTKYF